MRQFRHYYNYLFQSSGDLSHIFTQIAAENMATREKFSCDVKPLIPITAEAEKITGISLNGNEMTVKIYMYML